MNRKTSVIFVVAALILFGITSTVFAANYTAGSTSNIWATVGGGGQGVTLRVFGHNGSSIASAFPSVANLGDEAQNYAYGYVGWNVSGIAHGNYIVTSATLTLTEYYRTRGTGYSKAAFDAHPVEVHALNQLLPTDGQPGWNIESASNQNPGELYGTGDNSNYAATGIFTIPVNLLSSGNFQSAFNSGVNGDGQIALALTTTFDNKIGDPFYKFYSGKEDWAEDYAPLLSITYAPAPVPEPSGILALMTGFVSLAPILRRKTS